MRSTSEVLMTHISRTLDNTEGFSAEGAIALQIDIDVSAITSTPIITPRVQFFDNTNGIWVTIHDGDVIDSDEQHETIRIGPNQPTASELSFLSYLPPTMRLFMDAGDSDACVYGVNLILFFDD